MLESFTAGAQRAVERAETRARNRGSDRVEPPDLLAALLEELESRAVLLLAEHGVEPEALLSALDKENNTETQPNAPEIVTHSAEVRLALGDATDHARAIDRAREVGTEHLLLALVNLPGDIAQRLEQAGLRRDDLIGSMTREIQEELAPIPLSPEIAPLELAPATEAADLGRILDASSNRAREGLRVVEDYVRFALNDPMLTRRLKDCRHRLSEALQWLESEGRLVASRDTPGDVGTHIMTASEQARENPRAVLAANFKRTGEALRSLEEYAKLINVWLSGRFEVLRYDVYTLEKLVMTAVASRHSLTDARLYVLVGGLPTLGDLTWIVGEALAGGAQVIQLREKGLPDREILTRAREVRLLTIQSHAHFILNDRPDLARLSGADGVHLGQDDILPRDARRIVGSSALLGVSTHDRDQIGRSVLDGASYLGVGPVFPSGTKDFSALAGLEFVRQAAETSTLPWFAIGGINESNLDPILEAGARRIAVSASVVKADHPRLAARALRKRLDEMGGEL